MKCLKIIFIISLVCQLSISQFILGKSDAIFTYKKIKNVKSCSGFTSIAMNFLKFIFIHECPVVRINNQTRSSLIAISENNLLKMYYEHKWWESKLYLISEPKNYYSKNELCFDLKNGKNDLALSKQLEENQKLVDKYKLIEGSQLNIYKWNVDS